MARGDSVAAGGTGTKWPRPIVPRGDFPARVSPRVDRRPWPARTGAPSAGRQRSQARGVAVRVGGSSDLMTVKGRPCPDLMGGSKLGRVFGAMENELSDNFLRL